MLITVNISLFLQCDSINMRFDDDVRRLSLSILFAVFIDLGHKNRNINYNIFLADLILIKYFILYMGLIHHFNWLFHSNDDLL